MGKKTPKLNFRNHKGSIRRLDKASPTIFGFVVDQFQKSIVNNRYEVVNKGVKNIVKFSPISIVVPRTFQNEFKALGKEVSAKHKISSVLIYVQGNRKLCELRLQKSN